MHFDNKHCDPDAHVAALKSSNSLPIPKERSLSSQRVSTALLARALATTEHSRWVRAGASGCVCATRDFVARAVPDGGGVLPRPVRTVTPCCEVPCARTTTEIFCHRDFLFTRMPELIATNKSNGSCAIASPSRWSAAVHTGAFACVQCCLLSASAERRHYLRANVQRRSHTRAQEEPATIGSMRGGFAT